LKAAISAAGNVGTLLPALTAITDQSSPIIIVVRVAPDADAAIETANVIGGVVDNEYTGLQALLAAQAKTGIRPRILGAPGLETAAVTAAMVVVAKRLRAMVYAAPEGDSEAAVILERANYSARELMLIWPEFSGEFEGDAVARALGLRARIDEEIGWHKTISNVAVSGVTGLTKDIHFDLLDPSTPAGLLNDNAITTIIRHNGFRFWGNRTTSDTPEYAFESAVRSLHALQDEIESAMFPFVDQPITVALIKDILETINARFRKLVRDGRIIGAEAFFDRDDNAATDLAAGRPKFRIEFTPAAPNENPNIDLIITDFYYSGFADLVNS
jgi:phage tail sheath protein FI